MGTDHSKDDLVTIREAEVGDVEEVFTLAGAFATSFTPEMEKFRDTFLKLVERDDAVVLVAVKRGVAGYLLGFDHDSLFANGRVAWIEELMVDEGSRRSGIGRQLVARFEEWARARGNRLVALATRRAGLFYGAIGYQESAAYYRKLL